MSYWVAFEIDAGGPEMVEIETFNMTSNVAPMWRKAGAPIHEMDGAPAGECGSVVANAAAVIRADRAAYEEMNPENGWGSVDSCLEFLDKLADACRRYPKSRIRVSR